MNEVFMQGVSLFSYLEARADTDARRVHGQYAASGSGTRGEHIAKLRCVWCATECVK